MAPSPPRLRILSGRDTSLSAAPLRRPPCSDCFAYVKPRCYDTQANIILRYCSWRQPYLSVSLMAAPSYQCLRCNVGVEIRLRSSLAIWHIFQVSIITLRFPIGESVLRYPYRSKLFGNERFKPRHGNLERLLPLMGAEPR